jgi:hypothetical protein
VEILNLVERLGQETRPQHDELIRENNMSDEQVPDIEEIKERIEIPVEEETVEGLKADEKANGPDVVEEFKRLGRQFAEAVESIWNSEERVRVENEIREGVHSFADEVDKVIREARSGETAEKLQGEAANMKARAESSDYGTAARDTLVQGLSWLSDEFGKMAEQFAPAEKSAEDVGDVFDEDDEPVVEKGAE